MIKNLFNVLKKDPYALTGVIIYSFFIIIAIFADLIAPNDPLRILFNSSGLARNIDPGREFLLGTASAVLVISP